MNYYSITEEYLKNYKPLKASIENMRKEIEDLDYYVASSPSLEYIGEKKYKQSSTENAVINIENKKKKIENNINSIESKLERIEKGIETLNETEKYVIVERYFEGRQWWVIAYKLKYSERWCKELRRRAVEKISISLFGEKAMSKQFANTSP